MSSEKEYAATRAHQDTKDANALGRAAAQAAMVINGGAATASLAFISNPSNAYRVSDVIGYALGGYALGVSFGAATLLTLTYFLDFCAEYWENERFGSSSQKSDTFSYRWATISTALCLGALACFVISSVVLAIAVHRSF